MKGQALLGRVAGLRRVLLTAREGKAVIRLSDRIAGRRSHDVAHAVQQRRLL